MHILDIQYLVDYSTNLEDTSMHDLATIYGKVRDTIQSRAENFFDGVGNTRAYPNPPKMSDLEVISLAIAAECIEVISENLLWYKLEKDYPDLFPQLIHRASFNRRKKSLREALLYCTELLAAPMIDDQEAFLIDSIPIPTCKIVREKSSKACRRPELDQVVANKGYNPIVGGYFIGYKMHIISTEQGVYRDLLITQANAHDSIFLKEITTDDKHLEGRILIGDRGYIGQATQLSLFEQVGIYLDVPYRRNQKDYQVYDPEKRIKRKSIEVVFSQYCDEFRLRCNYAKRFSGFEIRILSKIAAKTFKQYWNFTHGRKINQTKHALAA
ncbi:MAG: IS982 family transposase [Saprospiraceae bacterium]|nr:IS982 family transposase [Saprospiraceae bacterium]